MITTSHFEFPPKEEAIFRKARRLEFVTLAYITSSAIVLYVTMGSSQAMRTSFFEDVLSTVPPLAFLVGTAVARRRPSADYPYGHHRATSIASLASSLALLCMGTFLLIEASLKAIHQERTTIGATSFGNMVLWAGWPMLAAVAYSALPAAIIGRLKAKLAPRIHDKVLRAQADMMKADWLAESATALGVLGVGLGQWWLDPLAAALVSLDILKDGGTNLRVAVADLSDHRPMRTDRSGPEDVIDQLGRWLSELDWVETATVRLREEGHVFFGEAFVVPVEGTRDLPQRVRLVMKQMKELNWRLHDVTLSVVDRLS